VEQVLEEAENLVKKGVKEIMVVVQDTTYYGMDLYGKRCLAELLEKLCRVEGIEWIRLHYAYPTDFPQDVIEVMAREPKICKYLDIPLQHLSDNQLELMHRRHTKAEALQLIERLRTAIPDIAIRTTMLVGYPNESAEDYEELCAEVERLEFDRLGVFLYSEEEGTFSATKLSDNVPQCVKDYRAEHLMAIQAKISHKKNEARVGNVERVIIDGKSGDFYIGRSQYDSPEVDEEILITSHKRLMKGKFYNVRITDADDFDLYGEVV
jgi:ribosomal protein S12 methylthiotransferase